MPVVCVRGAGGAVSELFAVEPAGGSSPVALPAQLVVIEETTALPKHDAELVLAVTADSGTHFGPFAKHLSWSSSAQHERAAIVQLGGGRSGYVTAARRAGGDALQLVLRYTSGSPATSAGGTAGVKRPHDLISGGDTEAGAGMAPSRQRLAEPPHVAAAPAAAAPAAAVGGAGTSSSLLSHAAASAAAPAVAPSTAGLLVPSAAAGVRGPPVVRKFLVYSDYHGSLVENVLLRRALRPGERTVQGGAVWKTDIPTRDEHAKGYWWRLQTAVGTNDWDFVWKPTVDFKFKASGSGNSSSGGGSAPPAAATHTFAKPTLHTLPPAPGGRLQLVNRMPCPRALSSKGTLWRSLSAWYAALPTRRKATHVAVPSTFVLRAADKGGMAAFRSTFAAIDSARASIAREEGAGPASAAVSTAVGIPAVHCAHNMWIMKPDHLFAGRGIEVVSSAAEVEEFLTHVQTAKVVTAEGSTVEAGAEWIVQKYVERPLLLRDRKFDIRVNVLVVDTDGKWDVYIYRDALCRTSSQAYACDDDDAAAASAAGTAASATGGAAAATSAASASSKHKKSVHVTNNCYQVNERGFGAWEEGNILSLDQLQTYIDLRYGEGFISVRRDLMPRWIELILDVLSAARLRSTLGNDRPRRWFDLLGFDVLIDEHFRSWLIEANTNPSIDFHCAYSGAMFDRLLEEMAQLTVDVAFPPSQVVPVLPSAVLERVDTELRWASTVERVPIPAWSTFAPPAGAAAHPDLAARAASSRATAADHHGKGKRKWSMIWSERSPLDAIEHQRDMRARALNRAAVDAAVASEATGAAVDVAGLVAAHGLQPLIDAIADTSPCVDADEKLPPDYSKTALGARALREAWRPVLRRYICDATPDWLYPAGVPPQAAL